jgi:hypothetical protein
MMNGKKQPKLKIKTSHQFDSWLRGAANWRGSSCGSVHLSLPETPVNRK